MKTLKCIMPFGMLSAISFFTMIILGQSLWKGYNPITSYISELTADGASNASLLRVFSNINYICLIIFTVGMTVISFISYCPALRIGYGSLFVMALISIVGFDMFPMTIDYIISLQNVIHNLITIIILCITIIATIFISFGYLKYDRLKKLGWTSLILTLLVIIFNIALLVAILQQSNIIGLIQRLGVFTFYIFLFSLSFVYTFRFDKNTLYERR